MKIIQTEDGSSTVINPKFPEQHYHSTKGAIGEALHTYIKFLEDNDTILEMGLGTGLNALLATQTNLTLNYTAIELHPIENPQIIQKLSFYNPILQKIHTAPWNTPTQITPKFTLTKINQNITNINLQSLKIPHPTKIFYDAFAPDTVPQQWTTEIFTKIFNHTQKNGKLLTYSSKGTVKQALREAGFIVKRLPGALGKHNMIMATKP